MNDVRRTWAEINLSNAAHNLKEITSYTGSKVMAVVKADAYGHGAVELALLYQKLGVDYFAVACLQEAVELRRAGIEQDILIFGATLADGLAEAADNNITQTVFSLEYAKQVSEIMKKSGKRLKVHFKVDTGMGRLGFYLRDGDTQAVSREIACAASLRGIDARGMFMHFADAENPDADFTEQQFDLFCRLSDALKEKNITFEILHCANSAAVVNYKKAHLEYVRPGLILYGLYPGGKPAPGLNLKSVMAFKSVVSEIRTVRAGDSISYGRTFTAPRDMRVAVVPAGYGDGLARGLSNFAEFILRGKRSRVLGRICMDMCMIDISHIPDAEIGDTVTLFGNEADARVTVDEWAEHLDTISYEICCLITRRVPRVYIED